MSPIRSLVSAALFSTAMLLSACATHGPATNPATTSLKANAFSALVPFSTDEGMARLARSDAKIDFAVLANQFEAQCNGAFCGPTSAAIVLNTLHSRSVDLPRDHTRLRKDDVQFMPAGADPIVPRFTPDSVIDRGPKTRAQVLGEPITIGGKQVQTSATSCASLTRCCAQTPSSQQLSSSTRRVPIRPFALTWQTTSRAAATT